MMDNQFNTANITSQHGMQMAQHVATSPPQTSAAVITTFLNAQQQHQHQLATAVASGSIYGDPRQVQLNANSSDKNYYASTAAALGAIGTPQRFYTTSGSVPSGINTNPTVTSNAAHHPNTILITNNFSHQQVGHSLNTDHQRNLRIVTSSNPLNQTNATDLAVSPSDFHHAQHVYSLNNNKQLQHLFPQHLMHQTTYQPTATELLQQHLATQSFSSSQQQQTQQNHAVASSIQMPHFYVSAEQSLQAPLNTNPKLPTNTPSNNTTPAVGSAIAAPLVGNNPNPNNSTLVLDRINICINNLYTDTSSSSASNSLASTPAQQPSPIIPAIQHKPTTIENGAALPVADIYESNVLVIDEPDSTTTATTPHTPPSTPENTPPISNTSKTANNVISTTSSVNSPSTSYNYQNLEKSSPNMATKFSFVDASQNIEETAQDMSDCAQNLNRSGTETITRNTITISQTNSLVPQLIKNITTSTTSSAPITPPTPPSPDIPNNHKEHLIETKRAPLFANGEDVFIKRHDDRFYLGTVIDTARNQFLVRFDDRTEIWCEAEEMRKLGVPTNGNASSSDGTTATQPMCVACKRTRSDTKVETCERCARSYHRKCTTETSPGSEIWLCKRCVKPMKLADSSKQSSGEEETDAETFHQLHYKLESLTWDDKHRTNTEQIYCYCGMPGKFDNNMLQCWQCLNWYHTHCTQKYRGNMLRGDCFFVFCCAVCNYGDEYLRRIQSNWVDLVHLVLYNLSIIKKHHKYHHLIKDINPYILEKRKMLPIPKEWISMLDIDFLEKVKTTLIENTDRFICGQEVKRDINSYALRSMDPPVILKDSVKSQNTFNDDFVLNNLKLRFLIGAPENSDFRIFNSNLINTDCTPKSKRKLNGCSSSHDIYEFDDTSEDEIPIKRILEKVKKTKLSPLAETATEIETKASSSNMPSTNKLDKLDVEDDNANDTLMPSLHEIENFPMHTEKNKKELLPQTGKESSPVKSPLTVLDKYSRDETSLTSCETFRSSNAKHTEKSSRKRKAFTLSKSYNNIPHIIDSSSDENSSSSSRGTSLDLIIPPPKNFLGQNNPFRIISPKKNASDVNVLTSSSKKSVSFGIFNTTALNFSSKLAALKSAGFFPKLSTSNLAKAAGQPRTVRTIKRRLSAKDITIGPNKEVRRRRTRRLSSNIEVISTTTINPIPTNFFPIQAKDLLAAAAASATTAASLFTTQTKSTLSTASLNVNNNISTSTSSSLNSDSVNTHVSTAEPPTSSQPPHGRRLRQRPQKNSPNTSRRSSISSNQSSSSAASVAGGGTASQTPNPPHQTHEDFKQTVNKYFGIVNRIESGEQFSIRAKRQLANGQLQYLIEWGETQNPISSTIQNLADQTTQSQFMDATVTM